MRIVATQNILESLARTEPNKNINSFCEPRVIPNSHNFTRCDIFLCGSRLYREVQIARRGLIAGPSFPRLDISISKVSANVRRSRLVKVIRFAYNSRMLTRDQTLAVCLGVSIRRNVWCRNAGA